MSSFYGYGGAGEGLAGLTVDGRAVQTEDDKIRFQSDVDRFDYLTVGTRTANSTLGLNSIATGSSNTASGNFSSANGQQTVASQQCAHAEGWSTNASGSAAHAEGYNTSAFGEYSHVQGEGTGAASSSQHVSGRYNILDNNGVYAEIVGNGTGFSADSNFRSNARTLDWNGNAVYTGKVTAGVGPINSMDLTTKLYVDNLITNMSGGTTYSVELSKPEVKIPLNFGQVDYWYQGGDRIGSILLPSNQSSGGNGFRSSAEAAIPENPDSYATDPSEPNKIYKNPNLPETVSYAVPFELLYKTYRGNEIVPGYLQSMKIVYSTSPGDSGESKTITAPFVKDVFIKGSWFDNDLENITTNQDGWVGWFSGFAYFVTPEELQEAMAGQSSSQSEQASPVRTDISPFLDATKQERQAFLILELTFNIEGHLVTKILPIYFINNHQPVLIRSKQSNNYSINIRPYPNTSYYIDGQIAALGIVSLYSYTRFIPMPFEVVFDTLSSNSAVATFDEENFHLPGSSDNDSYHIPEWFQLYPGTRYDISYDIMGNMTFASWDISQKSYRPA